MKTINRDRGNGQYAPSIDRMCRCGHPLGEHTAARNKGQQPCLADDCECLAFTGVRK